MECVVIMTDTNCVDCECKTGQLGSSTGVIIEGVNQP